MKKVLQKLMLAMLIALGIATQTQAQWIPGGNINNWFGQPDNSSGNQSDWTRSIGIGYFNTAGTYPQSFLHINTNGMILPGNGSILTLGEVFRTDCPTLDPIYTPINAWRMLTNGTEIGGIFNNYSTTNPNDLTIQSTQNNGNMLFNTGGANERMIIDANGHVGIGTKTPKAKLEVSDGDIAVTSIGKGIILKATDGDNYYRITVDNVGKINTELISKL